MSLVRGSRRSRRRAASHPRSESTTITSIDTLIPVILLHVFDTEQPTLHSGPSLRLCEGSYGWLAWLTDNQECCQQTLGGRQKSTSQMETTCSTLDVQAPIDDVDTRLHG
jgi:hypothetical protein